MKIFHNFDTELMEREHKDSVAKFGNDNALLLQRCAAYWYIRGYLFFLAYGLVALGLVFLIFLIKDIDILFYTCIILLTLASAFAFFYLFYTYLHYKMDFTIITPDEIITYAQKGILDSSYKSFPLGKIRSIKSQRTGLLGNIFGFGDIMFVTDGSSELIRPEGEKYGSGKMTLTYVSRPNELKKKIMDIAGFGHNKHIQG